MNLYGTDNRKCIWLYYSYYNDHDEMRGTDDRSFVTELSACYDNNTIYLYSEKYPPGMRLLNNPYFILIIEYDEKDQKIEQLIEEKAVLKFKYEQMKNNQQK